MNGSVAVFRRKEAGGFILIFTLAILFFLSVIGLATAYTLRLNAASVQRVQVRVQDEYLLDSAMQLAVLQLMKAKAAESVLKTMDPEDAGKVAIWTVGGTYTAEILGQDIRVSIEDASDLPDLNTFSREDVVELFKLMGASDSEAQDYLTTLQKARVDAAQSNGTGGFASMDEVLAVEGIPSRYRFGYKPTAKELEENPALVPKKGLDKLVTVGTGSKLVNLNLAPLEIIGMLTRAQPANLKRFGDERQARTLTLTDAVQMLGPMASNYLREGATLQVRITATLPDGLRAEALATQTMQDPSAKLRGFRILAEDVR